MPPRPVTEAEQMVVSQFSASEAASFRRSETPSRCRGTVQIDRRLEAQFVVIRSTFSRCVKELSGSRCAAGCCSFEGADDDDPCMMRGSSRDKGRSTSLQNRDVV